MKKKMLPIALGIIFLVGIIIGLLGLKMVSAQECRVIRILGGLGAAPLTLEPRTTFLNKGDCVVWFNRAYSNEVQVKFKEGKKCSDVTKSPMGFTLDAQSCFVTSWIPPAGTSSLRFMEKGIYKYVVKTKGLPGQGEEEGQIVVE